MSGPLDFTDDPGGDARDQGRAGPPAPPPSPDPPPARPPASNRSTWFVGGVALVFVIVVIINAVGGGGVEPGGPVAEQRLPPFAVPLAEAAPREDDDANVDGDRACRVRGDGILNMCEQFEAGPVVFALFPTDAARCRRVMDQFDRLAPRLRRVRFVAVGSRGDRDDLGRGHPYPVGWDRDGGLATAYGLVGCPQITFARRGGDVVETTRRELTDADLAERARSLTR